MSKKRNLAFYKKSGTPWTNEEYIKILLYTGDMDFSDILDPSYPDALDPNYINDMYIYDNGDSEDFMYTWDLSCPNFNNCVKVPYEDIFSN